MTRTHRWSISCLHSFRQTGNKHPLLSETHHSAETALARVIRTFTSLNPVVRSRLISPGLTAVLDVVITSPPRYTFLTWQPEWKIYYTLSFFHLHEFAVTNYHALSDLKQHKCIFSHFWRSEVKNKLAGQPASWRPSGSIRGELWEAACIPWRMAPASKRIARTSALASLPRLWLSYLHLSLVRSLVSTLSPPA